jgi:hypothetical protein
MWQGAKGRGGDEQKRGETDVAQIGSEIRRKMRWPPVAGAQSVS